jgi:hypothetical protein
MIYRWVYLLLPRVVDHDWGGGVGAGVPGILAVGGDRTYLVFIYKYVKVLEVVSKQKITIM